MDLTWHELAPDDLTARQMHDLLLLRHRVFVREQECPFYDDIDGLDIEPGTRHLLGADASDALVAYARVLAPDLDHAGPRIGRVVVGEAGRGTGVGHELARRAVALCERTWQGTTIGMSAQAHLVGYYGRHGFHAVGGVYEDEDGIPHVDMVRPPA